MSRDLDRETQAAIEALVFRLKNRTDEDDEPFAQEYVLAMRLRGWRPTEARGPVDYRNLPHGGGLPASEETQREIDAARRAVASAATRARTRAAETGDAA
jgi:hypothetical protein